MYTYVTNTDMHEHLAYHSVNTNPDVLFQEHNPCPAIACRNPIPHMKNRPGAAIVNTSSVWGIYPGPTHVAYCTSTGAVAALTKNTGGDCALWTSVRMHLSARNQYPQDTQRI